MFDSKKSDIFFDARLNFSFSFLTKGFSRHEIPGITGASKEI